MFTGLQRRFTTIFVLLTVIPLIFLSLLVGSISFRNLEQESQEGLIGTSESVAAKIESYITSRTDELNLLINLTGLPEENASTLLQNLLFRTDLYEEIALLDIEGNETVLLSRHRVINEAELANRADTPEFTAIRDGDSSYYSDVFFSSIVREPLMTISIPVNDLRSGELQAILVAEFRFRPIWQQLTDLKLTDSTVVYLIDSDTTEVIAHPDPSVVLRGTEFSLKESFGRGLGLSAKDVLFGSQTIELGNKTLITIAEQPITQALASAQQLVSLTLIITFSTLIVTIVVVTFAVRQVVRPIEKLSNVAKKIQSGDLSLRANVRSNDEIGALATSFNNMTEQLSQLIGNLEQRVKESTRDLGVAADVSLQITRQLDSSQLLADVVEQTAAAFNLYHVSIFLYDEDKQVLRLKQGVGNAGNQMVAMGKQFKLTDTGLVPQAAQMRQPKLSNNVIQNPDYFMNPLLPETQSELATPMVYRGILIGVLDIQSQKVNRFRDEDIRIMQTLADQIAVAVRNSQLFEELNVAKKEAEQANTVKSAFLASMSHELRTPLNAIINFSKFLKKGIPGPVNEEQEQLAGSIAESGQHLLNLINDVLDMSKIEAGSLKLYVESDIDFRQVIQTAMKYTIPLLGNKPVEMQQQLPDNLPLLTGDRKRLLQILLNILSNACKFTEEGYVTIRVQNEINHLLVSIEDTGSGIAPEDFEHVFVAFKQTESGLRHGGGGTGLGMTICQKLVEAHEGRIWFESHEHVGTTFFIELPLATGLIPERSKQSA